MPEIIRVNQTIYSWNSCIFTFNGIPFLGNGVVEFNYSQKRERKVVYGSRRDGTPLGKTSGKYSCEGSIKMLRDTADAFTSALAALGAGSYGDVEFVLGLQLIELPAGVGAAPIPQTVICSGVTIDEEKDAHAEGVDELVTEFTLGMLNVLKNGKPLYSLARGLP